MTTMTDERRADIRSGYDQAVEAVVSLMYEPLWLERLDADTLTKVLERLNERRPA